MPDARFHRFRLILLRIAASAAIFVVGLSLLLSIWIPTIRQFLIAVSFGWAIYPWQTLPRISFNPEIALNAAVTLALAVFGLHGVLRWLDKSAGIVPRRWPFHATAKIAALVLLLFVTSIAATGIIRQTGWLLSLRQPVSIMYGDDSIASGVGAALRMFAADHGENLPLTLDDLVPAYLGVRRALYGGYNGTEPPEQWRYFAGYRLGADPADRIVLASPSPRGDRRVIVHLDGAVETIFEAQFQELLAEQHRSEAED